MAFRDYTKPVLLEPARSGVETRAFVAEEAVKQGQVVKTGPNDNSKISPSDADGERIEGVAAYDAAAGDTVLVIQDGGLARLTSGTGSITAGDPIASHGGTGEEGEVATAASGDFVLGVARDDDNGQSADVKTRLDTEGFAHGGDPA